MPPVLTLAALTFSVPAGAAELLEPTPISAETYAESFTLSVDLGGGTYLQGQLAVSNLGPGGRPGGLPLPVRAGGGKEPPGPRSTTAIAGPTRRRRSRSSPWGRAS
ncbi:MAG: hypothetical protein H6730_14785 [Deltaproteobacteria bacterium]|nr:hypothetical protein [Deltaproteobacteria bacterium]